MEISDVLQSIHFRFLQPSRKLPHFVQKILERRSPLLQEIISALNTVISSSVFPHADILGRLWNVPRMSTPGVAAIIQECVRQMPDDCCYLNIGTWHGYTLFAGMLGNADKTCIGVDSFVQFDRPRERFLKRFQALRSPKHTFFDRDWREYLKNDHTHDIGVLFYDAGHDEESQYESLVLCDGFMRPGGIIFFDDTNWSGPRDGLKRFLEEHKNYRIILDQPTADNCHPTFWNGLMIVQKQ